MVCDKCNFLKLSKVIVPDKWKEGPSNTTEGGGLKKTRTSSSLRRTDGPLMGNTKCIICKQQVHQDAKYCHTCAYSKGVCAVCGKQVLDTKLYKQSNVCSVYAHAASSFRCTTASNCLVNPMVMTRV